VGVGLLTGGVVLLGVEKGAGVGEFVENGAVVGVVGLGDGVENGAGVGTVGLGDGVENGVGVGAGVGVGVDVGEEFGLFPENGAGIGGIEFGVLEEGLFVLGDGGDGTRIGVLDGGGCCLFGCIFDCAVVVFGLFGSVVFFIHS
jgi:hypothetical protein